LGTFMLGRLEGVIRPAILNHFPTLPGGTAVMLDGGANVDCRPEWLEQFAGMGSAYARTVLKIAAPRVGVLANGTEDGKGNELVRATHDRLRAAKLEGYLGLVEPHDAFRGNCDVLVVDGFTGNLILKATEGTVEMILSLLRREITRRPFARLGAFLVGPAFKAVRRRTSYDEYGAAVLLGVNKPTFIAHGRSNAKAIKNAILFARRMVEAAPAQAIAEALKTA
ncbi:MAG TPA: phosphate--acyl-ACP acyltransferase, partial [bacterium]|nr:phosphate--acyl-ACP acyltransferase [bacterium]